MTIDQVLEQMDAYTHDLRNTAQDRCRVAHWLCVIEDFVGKADEPIWRRVRDIERSMDALNDKVWDLIAEMKQEPK